MMKKTMMKIWEGHKHTFNFLFWVVILPLIITTITVILSGGVIL